MKQWLIPGLFGIVAVALVGVLIWMPTAPRGAQAEAGAAEESSAMEKIITLESDSQQKRSYRVLNEYITEDGRNAQDVESVDTGERLTLIDTPGATPTVTPVEEPAKK